MSEPATEAAPPPVQIESMADYDRLLDSLMPPSSEEAGAIIAQAPVAEQAPPAEAVAEQAPPTEEAPPPDEPAQNLANNFRLDAGHDPVTQLTFQILKEHSARGEHIRPSVAEAIARERLAPPLATEAPPEATAPETGTQAADPALAALMAQDAALAEQLKAAIADFDEAAQAELINQRAVLGREIVKTELRAEMAQDRATQQAASQQATAEAALAQSRAAVQAAYGSNAAPGSTLALLMQGIATEWEAKGDPRFDDPRLPELAAQEAAQKLGLKPAAGSAATSPPAAQSISAPQAPPRSTPQVAPPIAPGSARSSDPGTTSLPQLSNMTDYSSFLEKEMGFSQL